MRLYCMTSSVYHIVLLTKLMQFSFIHSFIYSSIYSFRLEEAITLNECSLYCVCLASTSFIHPFIHSFILPSTYSSIHLFTPLLQLEEAVTLNECSLYCVCRNDTKEMECQSISCHDDGFCGLKEGVPGCYCNEGFQGNGTHCEGEGDLIRISR